MDSLPGDSELCGDVGAGLSVEGMSENGERLGGWSQHSAAVNAVFLTSASGGADGHAVPACCFGKCQAFLNVASNRLAALVTLSLAYSLDGLVVHVLASGVRFRMIRGPIGGLGES